MLAMQDTTKIIPAATAAAGNGGIILFSTWQEVQDFAIFAVVCILFYVFGAVFVRNNASKIEFLKSILWGVCVAFIGYILARTTEISEYHIILMCVLGGVFPTKFLQFFRQKMP